MSTITSQDYLARLQYWVKAAERAIYQPGGESRVACYGPGSHGHWSLQANNTAFGGLAVLAADPDYDEKEAGVSRSTLLDYAMKLLRFALESHTSGSGTAFDGESWGHSWISALCIERMMHGIEAINENLTDEDWASLRTMLVSESDWLLENYPVRGAIDAGTGGNKPESNIWNGIIMHRTAMMYPDTPGASAYRERGTELLLNGISIPADADSDQMIDGKPLSEWHVGPNFTESFALNHHSYLNVGYMVICLSNIAMYHFTCRSRGVTPPEALYHNVPQLWELIRQCTFPDGRLWRIGGDSRVRYCYCQDYLIPAWMLMQDRYGVKECDSLEEGWLGIVRQEQEHNNDHTFLSHRLQELERESPLYFHRLEGDKAVSLSMGAYWRRITNNFSAVPARTEESPTAGGWSDSFHGAMMQVGKNRRASWAWEACQKPAGMCLPPASSDMAEWQWNLAGKIEGCTSYNYAICGKHNDWKFEGGFCTCGEIEWHADKHACEGKQDEVSAAQSIAFAALPDDATVVVMQQAKTLNRIYLNSVKGLLCNIPNDIFNRSTRTYRTGTDTITLDGCIDAPSVVPLGSDSVTVDDKLTIRQIYGADSLSIHRPGRRQVAVHALHTPVHGRSGGNLYCDEICTPCITERRNYDAGVTLFDIAVVVSTDVSSREWNCRQLDVAEEQIRSVMVRGADEKTYVVLANFSDLSTTVSLHSQCEGIGTLRGINCNEEVSSVSGGIELSAFEMKLFVMDYNG